MPDPRHRHHHHHAEPASVAPSILRLSAVERLLAASVLIAVLWAAVFWVMR